MLPPLVLLIFLFFLFGSLVFVMFPTKFAWNIEVLCVFWLWYFVKQLAYCVLLSCSRVHDDGFYCVFSM